MNKLKGTIKIEIKDAETLEVKKTITGENVLNVACFLNDMIGPRSNASWQTNSNNWPTPNMIVVSGRIIRPDNKTLAWRAPGHTYPNGSVYPTTDYLRKLQNSEIQNWVYTDAATPYIEMVGRFDSPAQVDTFNSVFLAGGGYIENTASSIALNTPCIQNPGEVLDITYRIQFFEQSSINTGAEFNPPSFYKDSYIATRTYMSRSSAWPSYTYSSFAKSPSSADDNELIRILTEDNRRFAGINPTTNEFDQDFDHFKMDFNHTLDKEFYVGRVIRSLNVGGNPSTNLFDQSPVQTNGPDLFPCAMMSYPLFDDDFAYKPIQPIQNHNKDAIEWGLDVDFLATSQGSLTVNGDSWTNPDWPEFWRVEFTSTGAVGASNYYFRNRRTIGFNGAGYEPLFSYRLNDMSSYATPTRTTLDNDHGSHEIEKNEEYGPDSYVSWDNDGINLHFINDSRVLAYDATTTPALTVTNIRQVAVDANDNIWVACTATGLWKITTPGNKNTATITNMTEGANGIIAGGGNICYAVARGSSDSIWAVVEGALIHTTNANAATPSFDNYNDTSPTTFSYAGLTTTGNWSSVKYIKVDRNTVDNELAVIQRVGNNHQIVWWSLAGVSYTGPISTDMTGGTSHPNITGDQINAVDVSAKSNLWARVGDARTDLIQMLEWGTSNIPRDLSFRASDTFSRPQFFYDYYDHPHIGNHSYAYPIGTSTSVLSGACLTNTDRIVFGRAEHDTFDSSSEYAMGLAFQSKRASGVYVTSTQTAAISVYKSGSRPDYFAQKSPSSSDTLDALNSQHSPYEELCWDKFHWNGSAWQKDYYVDAIDTSSTTNYPAKRHNFDTESHYFTGRSLIDVSDTFVPGNFADTGTFVFSVQPNDKLDSAINGNQSSIRAQRQDTPSTLFEFSTKTNRCLVQVKTYPSGGLSDFSFYEDGTETVLSSELTPLLSGSYRVVVIVNGTSVNVYVDGVQVGPTITLSSAYDWSNTTGDLISYIGARVYQWSHPQRHSPWPAHFFRGTMENVQMWNVAWDATDVANDYANVTGVITSKPASNLIARYELTESLVGTETKPTHAAAEVMDEGITIAFNDGASGDSFVATDYYTFGVVDGILKDNATSFTRSSAIYHKPVDHEFTEFLNESSSSVIEGVSTTQVTEVGMFHSGKRLSYPQNEVGEDLDTIDYYPGKLYQTDWSTWNPDFYGPYGGSGYTVQNIVNDGYFECRPAAADSQLLIGLIEDTSVNASTYGASNKQIHIPYQIHVTPAGYVDVVENNVLVAANAANYTIDSIFRIRKIAGVVTYHIDNGAGEVLLHTSSRPATVTVSGSVVTAIGGMGVVDAKINYTRMSNMLTVGNPATNTGAHNPNFLRIEGRISNSYEIFIDGSPAQVNMEMFALAGELTPPAPGEVTIQAKTGWLIFNDADIGKTVTGRVTVIYDEL